MIVFCDFDGTITVKDVGAEFFNNLMTEQRPDVLEDWFNGKINSKECLTIQCSYVKATKKEIDSLLDKLEIDKTFLNFYKELKKNNIKLIILSDGLDYYIRRVLKNYNLDDIEIYSNKLILYDNNKVKPQFPYYSPECSNFANCKGMQIKKLKSNSKISVFIGDAYSDRCAVESADVIFAKEDFYKYCREQKVTCFNFNNFDDILKVLKEKYPSGFHTC